MVERLLISVGTDGLTNWFALPDGQRFNLGTVSVLVLVTKAAVASRDIKTTLDNFLRDGQALFMADMDRVWALMVPKRVRMAHGPFMSQGFCERKGMNRFESYLSDLESAVSDGGRTASVKPILEALSKVSYGEALKGSHNARLAHSNFQTSVVLAEGIIEKAREVVQAIDKSATAGDRIKALRAKNAVRDITVKVAELLRKEDLMLASTRGQLEELAEHNDRLYGIFVR